jgi:hypothetical protein
VVTALREIAAGKVRLIDIEPEAQPEPNPSLTQ